MYYYIIYIFFQITYDDLRIIMAGMDDYQFYTKLRDQDNPFWEKADPEDMLSPATHYQSSSGSGTINRPVDLPQKLQPLSMKSNPQRGSNLIFWHS